MWRHASLGNADWSAQPYFSVENVDSGLSTTPASRVAAPEFLRVHPDKIATALGVGCSKLAIRVVMSDAMSTRHRNCRTGAKDHIVAQGDR